MHCYVCYYVEFGDRSTISGSMCEDEVVMTVATTNRWHTGSKVPVDWAFDPPPVI